VTLRRDGVVHARADRYAESDLRPLAEPASERIAGLIAKGVTIKQTALVQKRVDTILTKINAQRVSEVMASAVQAALGDLRAGGVSLQTCQHYLQALKQFNRWFKRDGRVRDDVLVHLTGYNAATHRKYERRALNAEELRLLFSVAGRGPVWRGMVGEDRAVLYSVAAGTGLRANELRSLTRESFRLDDDPPAVVLRAASSQHRCDDGQPIRADLAELLHPWLTRRDTDAPVSSTMPEKTALMVRVDLRQARAAWIKATPDRQERRARRDAEFLAAKDGVGRVIDFHALRADGRDSVPSNRPEPRNQRRA
jgi:site-specific recombinase XerC